MLWNQSLNKTDVTYCFMANGNLCPLCCLLTQYYDCVHSLNCLQNYSFVKKITLPFYFYFVIIPVVSFEWFILLKPSCNVKKLLIYITIKAGSLTHSSRNLKRHGTDCNIKFWTYLTTWILGAHLLTKKGFWQILLRSWSWPFKTRFYQVLLSTKPMDGLYCNLVHGILFRPGCSLWKGFEKLSIIHDPDP